MNKLIFKKDEKRVITVLLDKDNHLYSSSDSEKSNNDSSLSVRTISPKSKDSIASLQNDRVNGLQNGKVEIVLAGENASVEVVGLVIGKGTEERSLEAYITHAAANTKSNVNVRAVLRDKSSFAFRGNVKIEKGAKGADAYLRSDALLFDEAKMGDDTPALEILEPDVKAGHAATIGKVDEEMLFYLMSRGLTKRESEELIIEGFVGPIRHVIARNESDEAI